MAFPKRKARKIIIDKKIYFWCANLKGVVGDIAVTVQDEKGQGSLLIVKASHIDPWYKISLETGSCDKSNLSLPNEIETVTPAFVKSAILFGLSHGWNPAAPGKPVVLRFESGSFHCH